MTHDQEEALTLADRIVVLEAGAIVAERRAARGLPGAAQPVRGELPRRGQCPAREDRGATAAAAVLVTDAGLEVALGARTVGHPRALLVLRPEAIELGGERRPAGNSYEGVVGTVQYRGPTVEMGVDLATGERLRVLKTLPGHEDVRPGARVWLSWAGDQGW